MAVRLFITILTAALNTVPYNCLNVPSGKQVSLMYLVILQSLFELSQTTLVPVLMTAEKIPVLGSQALSVFNLQHLSGQCHAMEVKGICALQTAKS